MRTFKKQIISKSLSRLGFVFSVVAASTQVWGEPVAISSIRSRKMASAGFITMKAVGRRKAPSVAVKKIVVEIDPYSDRDRLKVA
jgi:hypothetical protein